METGRNSFDSPTNNSSKKRKIGGDIQASSDEEIPNLPEEIIAEILARLPVGSLLKFRCVSKSWRSLISSPSFVKSHLEIATKVSAFSRYRIMLTISQSGFNLKHCSIRSLMYEPSIDALDIDYPQKHPHTAVWVVGTCNGLICLAINEKDLFLWNPCTRTSATIPAVEVNLKPGFYNIFGFGYNEPTDDYKVLGIFCVFGTGGVYESVVKMYSLKANSWMTVEGFKSGLPLDDSGKLVNGKLHFAMTPGMGLNFRWNIVSIDLDSEAFGVVEQPNYGEGEYETSLGVLGGCICVLCNDPQRRVDMWVLKEYGVKESWTKLVTIRYVVDTGRILVLKPLYMLPSGEVLLVYGMHLAIYNPKNNTLRYTQINNIISFLDADAYVESLVSPAVNEN